MAPNLSLQKYTCLWKLIRSDKKHEHDVTWYQMNMYSHTNITDIPRWKNHIGNNKIEIKNYDFHLSISICIGSKLLLVLRRTTSVVISVLIQV